MSTIWKKERVINISERCAIQMKNETVTKNIKKY